MAPNQYVLVMRNEAGELFDFQGNRYNEALEMIDDWGNVISEPEEEPATSPYGNGSAGTFQPQTLADYNRPDLFYHKRAEIQEEIDRLNEEPPEQDLQFQEIPESEQLARVLKHRAEHASYFEKLDEMFGYRTRITMETPQGEVVHEKFEEKAEFDVSGSVSIDTDLCVDRHKALPSQTSSEIVSIDTDLCVDRHEVFPSQLSSVGMSIDTVLSVDRQGPSLLDSDILESNAASEPQPKPPEHVFDLPDPEPDPKPPNPDPTPPEHHETELVGVLPEGAATSGSCHKRKLPDTTLQPSFKRLRANSGVAVIPNAAYIIDPGDTFAVYSNGPQPPPHMQWYVLSTPLSSPAGTRSQTPRRAHPLPAAYLIDPEKRYAVYHLGPRPP